jgi:hypothetical protein
MYALNVYFAPFPCCFLLEATGLERGKYRNKFLSASIQSLPSSQWEFFAPSDDIQQCFDC